MGISLKFGFCRVFFAVSLLFISSLVSVAVGQAATTEDKIERGGWFTSLINRSDLESYAAKLEKGTLTTADAQDYVAKGGSLNAYARYNAIKSFFVSEPQVSILSLLVKPRYSYQQLPNSDRLTTIRYLLRAGADPNFTFKASKLNSHGYLAPVLQAAAADDIDALALFASYDADWELQEDVYLGKAGPALGLATQTNTLDWLLKHGAKLNFRDSEGRSLLHIAVTRSISLEKVEWLLSHGLNPHLKDIYETTPLSIVENLIKDSRNKLERYRAEVLTDESYIITEEVVAEEQARLDDLSQAKHMLADTKWQ